MSDIVVIGAGPAGLSAAAAAAEAGCQVLLLDEARAPGGQIYRAAAHDAVPKVGSKGEGRRKADVLAAFARQNERITYRPRVTVHSLYTGPEVQYADDEHTYSVKPKAVVVATGVSERVNPFPGWTLPGVLYAGGAQALLKTQGVTPGRRLVVAGAGPLSLLVAAQMARAGVEVQAAALLNPLWHMALDPLALWAGRGIVGEGLRDLRAVRKAGTVLLQGWRVLRAEGRERVEAVVLAPVTSDGQVDHSRERRLETDALAVNYGFVANSELARMVGAKNRFDPLAGGWLPDRDEQGETSVPGIFVAGDCAGLRGALVAAAEGRLVGAVAAARASGKDASATLREDQSLLDRHLRFQRGVRQSLQPRGPLRDWMEADTIVCRCEGVTAGRIDRALADGHTTLDALKRNTRCGMGPCGGRGCLTNVAQIVAGASGRQIEEMRPRPLARPVKMGALASPKTGT